MAAAVTLAVLAGCGGANDHKPKQGAVPAAECGQGTAKQPAGRQVRAMWIASVANSDWPSDTGLSAAKQKAEYRRLLDAAQRLHLNTVYMQIRPTADAFYPSPYEPWSRYLTGKQGGNPGYDPLKFLVSEAHARGLEFHAWFNPYRVSMSPDRKALAANNPARQHPGWVHRYGDNLWYDPGLPQVRQLATNVVLDVVKKYDIDGVHFDDYFYPYPDGHDFPDKATFKKYGAGFKSLGDWRRHNVDTLVQGLSQQIHQAKPWVKFGISPFGVWRNKSTDPAGSATKALQSYDEIYADTRTWVKKGWLDYVAPQLYWPIGFKAADYRTLTAWWAKQVAGTPVQLVIGQAAYQVGNGKQWSNPAELSRQVTLNAKYPQVSGAALFSARDVAANRKGFGTHLLRDHYARPAIPPVSPRLGGAAPAAPTGEKAAGRKLSWRGKGAAAYAVYRANGRGPGCIVPDGRFLVATLPGGKQEFTDSTAKSGQTYTYYVTSLDRLHHESPSAKGVTVTASGG